MYIVDICGHGLFLFYDIVWKYGLVCAFDCVFGAVLVVFPVGSREFVCVSGVACGVDCVFACGGIDRASSGVLGFVCGDYECGGVGVHDMVWVSMVFVYLCDCYGMFTVYMDVRVSYLSYVHIRRSGGSDL